MAKIFSSLIVGEDTEIVLSEDADLSGLVFPSEEEGKSPQEDQEKSSEEKTSDTEEQTDAEALAK